MLGIKLERYWHYVCHKSAEFQVTVQCMLTLCALRAYKHQSIL